MKTPAIVMTLALAAATFAFFPTADAVGTCSELKDSFCDDYLVCVGYRWDSRGFVCTGYGVRNPFDPCTCPPIAVLP